MIQLPNISEVTQSNSLDALKKVILAVQELSDQAGGRDTALLEKISENQRETNKKLVVLDTDIKDLKSTMEMGFNHLADKIEEQTKLFNNKFDAQTDLLRQIAENTKPR